MDERADQSHFFFLLTCGVLPTEERRDMQRLAWPRLPPIVGDRLYFFDILFLTSFFTLRDLYLCPIVSWRFVSSHPPFARAR